MKIKIGQGYDVCPCYKGGLRPLTTVFIVNTARAALPKVSSGSEESEHALPFVVAVSVDDVQLFHHATVALFVSMATTATAARETIQELTFLSSLLTDRSMKKNIFKV